MDFVEPSEHRQRRDHGRATLSGERRWCLYEFHSGGILRLIAGGQLQNCPPGYQDARPQGDRADLMQRDRLSQTLDADAEFASGLWNRKEQRRFARFRHEATTNTFLVCQFARFATIAERHTRFLLGLAHG
jgi:hypothetical protein